MTSIRVAYSHYNATTPDLLSVECFRLIRCDLAEELPILRAWPDAFKVKQLVLPQRELLSLLVWTALSRPKQVVLFLNAPESPYIRPFF